jgi:hypothetical protein
MNPADVIPLDVVDVDKSLLLNYLTARHVLSVMDEDFGVVGDGAANDAAGINTADAALVDGYGGGILLFPKTFGGYYIGATSLEMHSSACVWMGAGGGDYTFAAPVEIKTDVASCNAIVMNDKGCPQLKGLAVINSAAIPTGVGIKVTNCQNGRLEDVQCRGFNKAVEFNPGVIGPDPDNPINPGPRSCFGWSIVGSRLSGKDYGIDAGAQTNTLYISHTTIGAAGAPVRFKDSLTLTIDGASNIEGTCSVAIEIDSSTPAEVNAKIECHFEFPSAPPNGVIRLGNTARVWGVRIANTVFAGSGLLTVNCLNGSSFVNGGGNAVHGSTVAGDPLIGAAGAMTDPSGYAFVVANNSNTIASPDRIGFAQKNAGNAWKVMGELSMLAEAVVAGNEQAYFVLRAVINGVMNDLLQVGFDTNGLRYLDVDYIRLKDGATAPAASAGRTMLYVDAADGDAKLRFADNFVRTFGLDS